VIRLSSDSIGDRISVATLHEFLRSIDGVQQPAGVKIVDAAIDYHQINFGRIRIGAQGVLDLIVDAGQTAIHFAILQR